MRLNQFKRNGVITIVFSSSLVILSSTSFGPQGPYTGAPGDLDCTNCHFMTQSSARLGGITIKVNNGVTQYVPGQTYNITVTVEGSAVNVYGFSLSARKKADNSAVGELIAGTGSRVDYPLVEQPYIVHDLNPSSTGIWTFQWKAPANDEGEIVFYASGNAANGNQFFDGDDIYKTNLTLTPTVTALQAIERDEIGVFPNPTSGEVTVSFNVSEKDMLSAYLIDQTGRVVQKCFDNEEFVAGFHSRNLKLNPEKGIYHLVLQGRKTQKTFKVYFQ